MIKAKFLIVIFVLFVSLVLSLNFVSAGWFSPSHPNSPGFMPNNFNPPLPPPRIGYNSFIYNDFSPPYRFNPPSSPRFDYFYPNPPRFPRYIRNFW